MSASFPAPCQRRADLPAEIQTLIDLQRQFLSRGKLLSTCNRFIAVLNAEGVDHGLVHQPLRVVLACLQSLLRANSIARTAAATDVLRSMRSAITVLSRSAFSGEAK